MNSDIILVSTSTFSGRYWSNGSSYRFAEKTLVCPVTHQELAALANNFALAVLEDEHHSVVAVLGVRPEQNLFVDPLGKWIGSIVPQALANGAFKLLRTDDDQFALGFDMASGLLAKANEGEPFFDGHGQPTRAIRQILQDLLRVHHGQQVLARAAALLAEHDLLEPWPIKLQDGAQERSVTGLWRVSEQGLALLDDAAFIELRRSGALVLAYAQLLSMPNISVLGRLAQLHAQHAALASQREAEVSAMFEPLTENDGEIDWAALLKEDQV